ncbi:hypothetical protein [Parapedobacter defluvii]|uniref:hypothetical protein n=1 Tax=Parapedobacter defluvii TaxID=2045106 RepID=UPI00333E31A5
MLKRPAFVIIAVMAYLVIFVVKSRLHPDLPILLILYSISPLLVIWMVCTVIRYGSYNGQELREEQEWGYEDVK